MTSTILLAVIAALLALIAWFLTQIMYALGALLQSEKIKSQRHAQLLEALRRERADEEKKD